MAAWTEAQRPLTPASSESTQTSGLRTESHSHWQPLVRFIHPDSSWPVPRHLLLGAQDHESPRLWHITAFQAILLQVASSCQASNTVSVVTNHAWSWQDAWAHTKAAVWDSGRVSWSSAGFWLCPHLLLENKKPRCFPIWNQGCC
jgi:hypothetical protein